MPIEHRPRALLCDFDGVLRDWSRLAGSLEACEDELGVPRRSLWKAAFDRTKLQRVITGRASQHDWIEETRNDLVAAHGHEVASRLVSCWQGDIGEIDPNVRELLEKARTAGWFVTLITNASDRLDDDIDVLGVGGLFDDVVNSSVLGFAKPDERIYRLACRRAGCEPRDTVLLDDSRHHVDAARALGIHAVRFDSVDQMEREVLPLIEASSTT